MTPIPPVSAQAEAVRKLFLRHGFTGIQCSEQEVFVLGLVNEALDTERASHMFTVPAVKLANGALQVEAGLAGFEQRACTGSDTSKSVDDPVEAVRPTRAQAQRSLHGASRSRCGSAPCPRTARSGDETGSSHDRLSVLGMIRIIEKSNQRSTIEARLQGVLRSVRGMKRRTAIRHSGRIEYAEACRWLCVESARRSSGIPRAVPRPHVETALPRIRGQAPAALPL